MFFFRLKSQTEQLSSNFDNSIHNTEMPDIPIPNIELKLVNTYYFPPLSRQYASNREFMSLDINTNNPNKACFY